MKIRRRHWKSTWNNDENRSVIEAIHDRFSKMDNLNAQIHYSWSLLSDNDRNSPLKGVLATFQPEMAAKLIKNITFMQISYRMNRFSSCAIHTFLFQLMQIKFAPKSVWNGWKIVKLWWFECWKFKKLVLKIAIIYY
jgi:hypothetical protein